MTSYHAHNGGQWAILPFPIRLKRISTSSKYRTPKGVWNNLIYHHILKRLLWYIVSKHANLNSAKYFAHLRKAPIIQLWNISKHPQSCACKVLSTRQALRDSCFYGSSYFVVVKVNQTVILKTIKPSHCLVNYTVNMTHVQVSTIMVITIKLYFSVDLMYRMPVKNLLIFLLKPCILPHITYCPQVVR